MHKNDVKQMGCGKCPRKRLCQSCGIYANDQINEIKTKDRNTWEREKTENIEIGKAYKEDLNSKTRRWHNEIGNRYLMKIYKTMRACRAWLKMERTVWGIADRETNLRKFIKCTERLR